MRDAVQVSWDAHGLSKAFISGPANTRFFSERLLLPKERRRGFGWWPDEDKKGHLSFKDLKPNKKRERGLESIRSFSCHVHIVALFWPTSQSHNSFLSQHTYNGANIYIFRQVGTVNRGLLANCFHLWILIDMLHIRQTDFIYYHTYPQ